MIRWWKNPDTDEVRLLQFWKKDSFVVVKIFDPDFDDTYLTLKIWANADYRDIVKHWSMEPTIFGPSELSVLKDRWNETFAKLGIRNPGFPKEVGDV